ncbi:MAG: hypothetical protein EOO41_03050, partial [Methanobacteriota archaeon]
MLRVDVQPPAALWPVLLLAQSDSDEEDAVAPSAHDGNGSTQGGGAAQIKSGGVHATSMMYFNYELPKVLLHDHVRMRAVVTHAAAAVLGETASPTPSPAHSAHAADALSWDDACTTRIVPTAALLVAEAQLLLPASALAAVERPLVSPGRLLYAAPAPVQAQYARALQKIPRTVLSRSLRTNFAQLTLSCSATSQDGNEEMCAACGSDGDIVCCDACPSSYHPGCDQVMRIHGIPEGDVCCNMCLLRCRCLTLLAHASNRMERLRQCIAHAATIPSTWLVYQLRLPPLPSGVDFTPSWLHGTWSCLAPIIVRQALARIVWALLLAQDAHGLRIMAPFTSLPDRKSLPAYYLTLDTAAVVAQSAKFALSNEDAELVRSGAGVRASAVGGAESSVSSSASSALSSSGSSPARSTGGAHPAHASTASSVTMPTVQPRAGDVHYLQTAPADLPRSCLYAAFPLMLAPSSSTPSSAHAPTPASLTAFVEAGAPLHEDEVYGVAPARLLSLTNIVDRLTAGVYDYVPTTPTGTNSAPHSADDAEGG